MIALTDKIIARDKLTTLMVTHSMQQAATLGDRLIMMHRGQRAARHAGPGKEARPRRRFARALRGIAPPRTARRKRRRDAGARLCLTAVRRLWLGVTLIVAASGFLLLSDWKQRAAGPSAMPRSRSFSSTR